MIHFVVHDEGDSVGVVVVEGVRSGQKLNGWIMDQDKDIVVDAKSDIPIGHKLAIRPLKSGDTVIKYGVDIGKTIADIAVGEHTHVQNLRTKRWSGARHGPEEIGFLALYLASDEASFVTGQVFVADGGATT